MGPMELDAAQAELASLDAILKEASDRRFLVAQKMFCLLVSEALAGSGAREAELSKIDMVFSFSMGSKGGCRAGAWALPFGEAFGREDFPGLDACCFGINRRISAKAEPFQGLFDEMAASDSARMGVSPGRSKDISVAASEILGASGVASRIGWAQAEAELAAAEISESSAPSRKSGRPSL